MREKISSLQIGGLCAQMLLSCGIGIFDYVLILISGQNSWIAIILGMIGGLIPLSIYLYIINIKTDMNILEKFQYFFGNIFGKILSLIIFVVVVVEVAVNFSSIGDFISSQYLHKTPLIVINMILLIPIIYLFLKGLTVISRSSFILLIISFILIILTILGLMPESNINNLFPILENGFKPILKSSYLYLAYSTFPFILLTIIPKDTIKNKEKLNKYVYIFYFISNAIFLIISVLIITSLGIDLAKFYQYAEYHALKRVSLIGFVERLENFLSLRWIFYMFTTIVFGFYFIMEYFRNIFKKVSDKNVKLITVIFIVITLVTFDLLTVSGMVSKKIIVEVLPPFAYIAFLIIPLLLLVRIKTKKN